MNKSDSIGKIAAALVKAQGQMTSAIKDAKNPFFKSNYADLNAVREACMPALNANGISVLQPTVVVDGKNYVETVLIHESGEFLSGLTEIKVAKINDPQCEGSGISYARRYSLQSMVCLGAVDDDGESAMGRTAKPTESIIKKVAKEESVATAPATTATTTSQETHKTEKPKSTFRKLKEESNGSVW